MLKDTLFSFSTELIFLSEPQIFQSDIDNVMRHVQGRYCYFLNSDDLHDSELAMIKNRSMGGTLLMWTKALDPYVTIHTVSTCSYTPLILQLPGYQVSIHIALYLPTSGRDLEFVSELSNLRICVDELQELYPDSTIFIRGDSNVNKNNKNRVLLFKQFLELFSLSCVKIEHNTYHHFVGQGLYDSNIDVLLHSEHSREEVVSILCQHDYPAIQSHHDIILSKCFLSATPYRKNNEGLLTAPRIPNNREKINWTPEGSVRYEDQVQSQLRKIRETWCYPSCKASMSILLQMTNFVLSKAASSTNKAVNLSNKQGPRSCHTPRPIQKAKQRMNREHKKWKTTKLSNTIKNTF